VKGIQSKMDSLRTCGNDGIDEIDNSTTLE
jgi:hypothetical protein